jgi:hypothetical protein
MGASGHYLKPGKGATAPDTVFAVVCDRAPSYTSADESLTVWDRCGSAVAVMRRRRGTWSEPTVEVLPADVPPFDYVQTHATPRARNYVFTPHGVGGLALAGVWEAFDRERVAFLPRGTIRNHKNRPGRPAASVALRRVCLSPRCLLLDYALQERSVIWLGTGNYFGTDEEQIARDNCFEWPDTGFADTANGRTARTARERALLWVRVFARLSDWWRTVARAPFGVTAAALGQGVLRSHVKAKEVCSHNHTGALGLERHASFGGSARVWFFGDVGAPSADATPNNPAPRPSAYPSIPGPVECWDVRSMYPWIMSQHELPTSLYSYREDLTKSDLDDAVRNWGVVARVTIETDRAEYPARSGGYVLWPVGKFTTTLTGPELLALKRDGRVVRVHAVARYRMGRAFGRAAQVLLDERLRAREIGNATDELFAKAAANGMGGKLAQKKGQWIPAPRATAPVRWGEWVEVGERSRAGTRYRTLAGITWKYEQKAEPYGPHVAAFAYLTALGRLHLRAIRESLPERSVVQCDTDGLWVLPNAFAAVRARSDAGGDAPGRLRLVTRAENARFLGPRHYYAGGEWTLAGFTRPIIAPDGITVHDVYRIGAISDGRGGAGREELTKERQSVLKVECRGLKVGSDGWAAPRSLTQRAPRRA